MRIFVTLALLAISAAPAGAQSKALWNVCSGNNYDRRIPACTKILAFDRLKDKAKASAYYNRCVAYKAKKQLKLDLAIADCSEAIRLNPEKPHYYSARAVAYYRKRQYDRAIADADAAIRLDPKRDNPYYWRGISYALKGKLNLAITDFNKAIELAPDMYRGFYSRGRAYEDKGDLARARADFRKALSLNPTNARTREALKRVGTGPGSPPAGTSTAGQSITAEELGKLPDIEGLEKLR